MPKHHSRDSLRHSKTSSRSTKYTTSDPHHSKVRHSSERRSNKRSREHSDERSRHMADRHSVEPESIGRKKSLPEHRTRRYQPPKRDRRHSVLEVPIRQPRRPTSRSASRRIHTKALACVLVGVLIGSTVGASIGYGIYVLSSSGSSAASKSNNAYTTIRDTNAIILQSGDSSRDASDQPGLSVSTNSAGCGELDESVPNPFSVNGRKKRSSRSSLPRRGRIVGGDNARIDQHPWQVSLWTNSHTCGGSIIASNWILFAAHCVQPFPHTDNWTIFVGEDNRLEMRLQGQTAKGTHLIAHAGFDPETYDNDVALLRLNKHLKLGKDVRTVCLPDANKVVKVGTVCQISGWGSKNEGGKLPAMLQRTNVHIFDWNQCNRDEWLVGMVTEKMFCAGTEDGSRDACQGDSGGPLTCYDSGKFYQMGLVSWGIGCGEAYMPGVYTNLSLYSKWITENVVRIEAEIIGNG